MKKIDDNEREITVEHSKKDGDPIKKGQMDDFLWKKQRVMIKRADEGEKN